LPCGIPVALLGVVLAVVLSPWWLLLAGGIVVGTVAYGAAVAGAGRPDRHEPSPMKVRLLGRLLPVAQPFWPPLGRFRGTPARPGATVRHVWSGARWAWLDRLETEWRAARCHVTIGDPSDSWDLRVSNGGFAHALVTTAVMWSWEPHVRVVYRPRPI